MRRIYSSLDIGTDSIKLVVCELYKNRLNLLAASSIKSKGIKKGLITDIHEVTVGLQKVFNEVEAMLGIKIKKVIASVPCYFSDYTIIKGSVKIQNEDGVDGNDIVHVLEDATMKGLASNKELINILPIDFSVDEGESVTDPKGLIGDFLYARAIMVSAPKKNVYSVMTILDSIGIEVVDVSSTPIGDIYAIKTKDLNEKTGCVVNIGCETTTVSLYNKGIPVKSTVIGMGGKSIDNDLSYIYKIDLRTARRLKEKFALAHKKYASMNEFYEIEISGEEPLKINQFEASEISMERIYEILELVKKEIRTLTTHKTEYIFITGGVSNMEHFEYAVSDVLGDSVKIGNVKLLGVRNNKYVTAVGNIIYYINKLKLKGINDTMVSSDDAEAISSIKKNVVSISGESMLGKVFGYFFGE